MPKHKTVLQVFVASPSDVNDERGVLDQVVSEVNKILSHSLNISFELIMWENDVRPGFSYEPQAVINNQVPDDYDVFIGIFWSRVGTPTKSSFSGSLEEFQRALSRYKRDGSPEIMVYFKDAPIPPAKIDIDQFGKLLTFKNSISSEGGLYSTFEDMPSFESSLRMHLAALAKNASRVVSAEVPIRMPLPKTDRNEVPEEELGFLDYMDIHTQNTEGMTECLDLLTRLIVKFTERTSKRTAEMRSSLDNVERSRLLVREAAEDMSSFADEVRPLIVRYAKCRENAFEALGKTVMLHNEMGGDGTRFDALRVRLFSMLETMATTKNSVQEMRDATINLPRLTKELNAGKRSMVGAINALIVEIGSTETTARNVLESIAKLSD